MVNLADVHPGMAGYLTRLKRLARDKSCAGNLARRALKAIDLLNGTSTGSQGGLLIQELHASAAHDAGRANPHADIFRYAAEELMYLTSGLAYADERAQIAARKAARASDDGVPF